MIYLNNATTTWPKPDSMYVAVDACLRAAHSPGRMSAPDGDRDALHEVRREMATFLGVGDPTRLVFTPGCTFACNTAVRGLPWAAGDVAVISGLEHHAVSRSVRRIARERSVRFEVIPYTEDQPVDLEALERILRQGRVRLVACMMASNVTGHLLPVKKVVALAHAHGAICLVDAAQAVGVVPVQVQELGADLVTVAGHKGLFGPPGVGALYIAPQVALEPLLEGGTGHDSGRHESPRTLPSAHEVGTLNLPALEGLRAGIRWIQGVGWTKLRRHEEALTQHLLDGLREIAGIRIYGPRHASARTSAVSLTLAGESPKVTAAWLWETHQIVSRAGYHCAPLAHETIGTLPGEGTLRLSPGYFTTTEEIDRVVAALRQRASKR